jgi:hypothetical protein
VGATNRILQDLLAVWDATGLSWLGNAGWLVRAEGELVAFDLDRASRLRPSAVPTADLAPVLGVLFVSPTRHTMRVAASKTLVETIRPGVVFPRHFDTYRPTAKTATGPSATRTSCAPPSHRRCRSASTSSTRASSSASHRETPRRLASPPGPSSRSRDSRSSPSLGGRLILGLGNGDAPGEFGRLRLPWPAVRDRQAALVTAIGRVAGLWAAPPAPDGRTVLAAGPVRAARRGQVGLDLKDAQVADGGGEDRHR